MSLTLSDEQRALQETAADFLAAHTNARKDADADADAELWSRIVELGWAAVQVPEDFDGLGLGPVELALLMEEMGRRLVRTPFLGNVVLAQTALLQAGTTEAQQGALAALAYGERTATLILGPGLDAEPASLSVKARRDGEGWVLAGEVAQVLDDGLLTHAYVAARIEEAPGVALFELAADAAGLTRTPLDVFDLTRPQARWTFADVRVGAEARVDDPARVLAGLARTRVLAALQLAAEQVGGAAQCLQLAVDYTKERVQFGKPVASFQAVKHRVAEMMVRMETARSTVRGVAAQVAQGAQGNGLDDAALAAEVAAARVQATEAYRYCAQEAIQLHGGVGFTWEYDPQLHFKRAQWASQWFGPTRDWREALAAHLLDAA